MTRKLVSLFLALALVLACVPVFAEGGISTTDMFGREIKLDAPAERVVVLMPADAEILYALGAGDTIVGVGSDCIVDAEAAVMPGIAEKPVMNPGYAVDVEGILALQPQLVILTAMAHSEDLVNSLAAGQVQVVVTNAQDLEGVYTDIALLGRLMGKDNEAEALIADMKQKLSDIAEKAGNSGKTLYVDESPLIYGLWSAGKGTYIDDIASICGLTNIFSDIEGHQSVSEEQVLDRNPDIILTMSMYYGDGPLPDEEILSREGWDKINAVRDGAVIYDPTNAVALPGPRLVNVAEMLLKLAVPETETPAA